MMKHLIKTVFLLSLVIFSLSVLPALVRAEDYTVRSALLIPADWKDKFTFLQKDNYTKKIIPEALKEVQDYYWQKIGKTFKINSGFDIVYSTKKISEIGNTETPDDIYRGLDGEKLLPPQTGVIRVIWIIGTPSNPVMGTTAGNTGIVTIRDEALRWLAEPLFISRLAKGVIAHELGHAFGLDFAGYSLGHPCTVVSENECTGKAPKPYPPAKEWNESIMGYGSQNTIFNRGLLSVGFNNTSSSPEIWKLYKNPFLNPENDAPPPFASKPPPLAEIAQILPNPINDGEVLEIKGFGLKRGLFKIYRRDENGQEQQKEYMVEKKDDDLVKIRLLASPNIIPPNSETRWKIALQPQPQDTDTFEVVEASEELVIKGSQPRSTNLKVDFSVTCGEGQKEPVEAIIKLVRVNSGLEKKEETLMQAQSNKSDDGWGQLTYIVNESSNYQGEYYLVAEPLPGVPTPEAVALKDETLVAPDRHKVVVFSKNFIYYYTQKVAPFNFPECPSAALNSAPSPSPSSSSSSLSTPVPSATGNQGSVNQSQVTRMQISNYPDFRSDNAPGDFGSPTVDINNPSGYKVRWTLSTLTSDGDKKVYVRTYEGDNYTDYSYSMMDGRTTQAPSPDPLVEITAQSVNRIIRMTAIVNGQNIDINPESGTQVHLDGNQNEAKDFVIAYEIEDAKDGIKRGAFNVSYRPDQSASPSPTSAGKTVRGFYCSGNQMIQQYTDQSAKLSCTCGDNEGDCTGGTNATICQNASPEEVAAAGLEFDAKCVKTDQQTPAPSSSAGKTLKGWWCVDSTHMYRQYSDGSREPDCICGDGSEDCGKIVGSICHNKDQSQVPAGYDVDAECVESQPAPEPTAAPEDQSCLYFKDGENNCIYSAEDGKCYAGHTSDQLTCTWQNGGSVCFNPSAGCEYRCGPVNCPSY